MALGSGAQLRKKDLENDMLVDEHTQCSPGTTVGAATVGGIIFQTRFIEEGIRTNTECTFECWKTSVCHIASFGTRRCSSPTKSLLRTATTMTLHSRVCFAKLTEYIVITLCEKTCLSVCRRLMSDITVRPVGDGTGRPVEQTNQEAQI